jgi:DNA mismatch repair protein MutS2
MLFDKEHLQPTYKLKVGKPGSSYAFEVAKKIGLDERIIKYARKKVGKKENEVEDLLVDLQEGKAIIDEQLDYIHNEKKQLEKLMTNYNQLNEELQIKRKKLQIQAKELKIERSNEENLLLQNLISKLQKEKNLEKAKKLKEDADRQRSEQAKTIYALKKDVSEARNDDRPIEVGGYVRVLDSDLTGEVLNINGNKAEVLVGLMKMWVAMVDLIPIKDPLEVKRKGINIKGVAFENSFSPKLDIRGYKIQDATETLQEFFDKALLSNARTLEVVHGKGSGALRKLVIKKMKEYKDLDSYWHPADESGGDGVTMIQM